MTELGAVLGTSMRAWSYPGRRCIDDIGPEVHVAAGANQQHPKLSFHQRTGAGSTPTFTVYTNSDLSDDLTVCE